MYLVLSALTSSPISVVAATKASAFSFRVCILPPSNAHKVQQTHIRWQQYTQDNNIKQTTTIHTRQLQQYAQDNYNNTHKTLHTTTTIHTRQLTIHVEKVNNTKTPHDFKKIRDTNGLKSLARQLCLAAMSSAWRDKIGQLLSRTTAGRSRKLYTSSAIFTAWHHFIRRWRFYGELISPAITKNGQLCFHVKCQFFGQILPEIWIARQTYMLC